MLTKKKVQGRKPKRRKGALHHLGLELLWMCHKISPALMEVCISMAVLCPSFEVAANALRGFDITMNDHLLQNITNRMACLAKQERVACCSGNEWKESGLRILVSVDGGRIRERCENLGRLKKDVKRHGYSTDWFEPRLLIITQFDKHGIRYNLFLPSWMDHAAAWMIFLTCSNHTLQESTLMRHQRLCFAPMVAKAFGPEQRN